jgi:hypothetical protein
MDQQETEPFFEWVKERVPKIPVGAGSTVFEMRKEVLEGPGLNVDVIISRPHGR